MKYHLPQKRSSVKDDYWISLSDMMTSLMMVFLLISVIYMIKVNDSVKVPQIYKRTVQGLDNALTKEFDKDLHKWGAAIDKDLTVRFQQPDILFPTGSADLTPKFKEILDDFFPRYLKIMRSKSFINTIEEIRIEGHTSSLWEGEPNKDRAYFKNMKLSQERTSATLEYIMSSEKINLSEEEKGWLMTHFSAIGFSSSHPLTHTGAQAMNGKREESRLSQRVEFRVRTNIEQKVAQIVEKNNAAD